LTAVAATGASTGYVYAFGTTTFAPPHCKSRRWPTWAGACTCRGDPMTRALFVVLSVACLGSCGLLQQEWFLEDPRGGEVWLGLDEEACALLARLQVPNEAAGLRGELASARSRGKMLSIPPGTSVKVLSGRVLRNGELVPFASVTNFRSGRDVLISGVLVLDGPFREKQGCVAGTSVRAKHAMP
jgi:hypothetical protein